MLRLVRMIPSLTATQLSAPHNVVNGGLREYVIVVSRTPDMIIISQQSNRGPNVYMLLSFAQNAALRADRDATTRLHANERECHGLSVTQSAS